MFPSGLSRSGPVRAGRGLNPRPESSTPARAEEQPTESRNQLKDSSRGCLSGFEIAGRHLAGMERSDLVLVGG